MDDADKAALAILLTPAAAQIAETQAAVSEAAPEPVESDEDFNGLLEKQKALANQLKALKQQEAELLARLQSVRDEVVALEHQSRANKAKAQALVASIFGVERPAVVQSQPVAPPAAGPAPHKVDNSIVTDINVPIAVTSSGAVPTEANVVSKVPSLIL